MATTSGAVRAGRAFVEISGDDAPLNRVISQSQQRLTQFGQSVNTIGGGMGGSTLGALLGGAAIGGGVGGSITAFADFEKQMRMVSTMLDQPQAHMEGFTAAVRKLSQDFGEDTSTIAKGLYDILSASVAPEQAVGVLTAAMRAAKAGMTDTATATQALINVMNAYQLPASRISDISDVMFITVKRGVTTFAELAQYQGMITATSHAAGLSLDQMGASLATLTRNGLKTDVAVTGLQNVLAEFLKPSVEGAAVAEKYGLSLSSATLKAEGLSGALEKLKSASPEDLAKIFPDVRGLRAVMALVGDLKGLSTDLDYFKNRAGAAEEAYKKMTGTLGGAMAKAQQSAMDAARAIGNALSPVIITLADAFRATATAVAGAMGPVNAFIAEHSTAIGVIVGVTGALLAGKAVYALVAVVIGQVIVAVKALAAGFMFLAANPAVLAIASLIIVAAAAAYAIHTLTTHTAECGDAMQKLREAGDQQRQSTQSQMARLAELAEQTKLTATQMEEAKQIIKDLPAAYGNLGIAVDEVTGKIVGFGEAQKKMSKEMKEQAAQQLVAEYGEALRNAAEYQFEADTAWTTAGKNDALRKQRAEKVKAEKIIERLDALNRGDETAVTGAAPVKSPAQIAAEGLAKNGEHAAAIDERVAKAEIDLIEDEHQRAIALENHEYLERIKKSDQTEEARKALAKEHDLKIAKIENTAQKKLDDADQKRIEQEEKDRQDAIVRAEQFDENTRKQIEDAEIDAIADPQERDAARLELERQRALREARIVGGDEDQVNALFDARKALAQSGGINATSTGTFNAAAVGGLGQNVAMRTAVATEAMQKDLAEIRRHGGGLAVSA